MFIGRNRELELLDAFYASEAKVACVTGPIGMGKTALLNTFAEGKESIYFCAYETSMSQELALFAKAVGLKKAKGLAEILDKVSSLAKKAPQLLIMDQYPLFAKADASFDATLYQYVTEEWKDLPVKVIFCGDSFLAMEKFVYGKKARWASDLGLTLQLQGLTFVEVRQFFPEASEEDAVVLYGISGGIPGQLELMQGLSVKEAVKAVLANRVLLPEFVMGTELRELSYYNCILCAMAQGMNRVNQLSEEVGKPKDVVVPYLNALMSIGVVGKQTAITEESNRKKTRYYIVNTNTVFWYQFIVPNWDLYATGQWDKLWDECIFPHIGGFLQLVFVRMSKEYLERSYAKEHMGFAISRSGNWWTNDDEAGTTEGFDIVSLGEADSKAAAIFTLCFYEERTIGVAELKWMIEMTKRMKHDGDVFYVVCAKDRFHENVETVASTIKNISLITLQDVIAM